jgi:hypothetical protein
MRSTQTPTRKRGTSRTAALWLALAGSLAAGGNAQSQGLSETQLRARFVLNFVRFTEWPEKTFPAPDTALNVCVLGASDAFDGALLPFQGATAGRHKIEIRNGVTPDQARDCHLLFVLDSELRRLQGARESIGKRAVLIVGESEAVLDRGGMIALRTVDRHLSFVVKLGAARDTDLNFSPQMLRAAAEVLP